MDKVNNCVSWRPSVRSCRCQKEQVVTKIVDEVRILLCARVSPQPCHPSHGASTGQYNCMYLSVLHTYPHTQANAQTRAHDTHTHTFTHTHTQRERERERQACVHTVGSCMVVNAYRRSRGFSDAPEVDHSFLHISATQHQRPIDTKSEAVVVEG